MITFVKEYHVNKQYVTQFERAYAVTGAFGGMFVRHGCSRYALLKDKHQPQRYVLVHAWSDPTAFSSAQERAAQESYNFQQRSHGWIASVRDLDSAEGVITPDQYDVVSES